MRYRHRALRHETLENRSLLAAVHIEGAIMTTETSIITVPVNIDDAGGLRAAEIRMEYDPTTLDVHPQDVRAGSVWLGKASAVASVDEKQGTIVAYVFGIDELQSRSGSLIDIQFAVRANSCSTSVPVALTEVRLNEGQIEASTVPPIGPASVEGTIAGDSDSSTLRSALRLDGNWQSHSNQAQMNSPPHHFGTSAGLNADQSDWPSPKALNQPTHINFERDLTTFVGPLEHDIFAMMQDWH